MKKKPVYKRWWFIVLILVVVIGAFGSCGDDSTAADNDAPAVDTPVVEQDADVEEEQEEEPALTMGQKNALGSANSYLSVMAFSYTGLIDQLEYEGYSTEDATFAADNCGADWYEQAAKKAEEYLDVMSFSRDGLIDQLEYEGFTTDQAVYGVEAVGY